MRWDAYLELAEIELGGRGDNVGLVNPPEGDTVDLVWASNQKQSARQLLQEHHTLTAEATREENEDGAGCDG